MLLNQGIDVCGWSVNDGPTQTASHIIHKVYPINTQPLVPDCLTIDFANTTWIADVALQKLGQADHFTVGPVSQTV